MEFSFFGTSVKITVGFACVMSFLLLTDRTGIMPYMLLSFSLHELGHLTAMHIVGIKARRMVFSCVGITIVRGPDALSYRGQLLVSAAGPLMNLFLGISAWLAARLFLLPAMFSLFSAINFSIAAFQLIPAASLDGQGVLYAALCLRRGEGDAYKICRAVSVVMLLLLCAAGGILIFKSPRNPTLLILAVYMLIIELLTRKD